MLSNLSKVTRLTSGNGGDLNQTQFGSGSTAKMHLSGFFSFSPKYKYFSLYLKGREIERVRISPFSGCCNSQDAIQ